MVIRSSRETARALLADHPVHKHTWAMPLGVSDSEFFDEMPMRADGEFYDPTDRPRHRVWQADDIAAFTNSAHEHSGEYQHGSGAYPDALVRLVEPTKFGSGWMVDYLCPIGLMDAEGFYVSTEELSTP